MLDLKRFGVRAQKEENSYGSYHMWYFEATSIADARKRAKRFFGPGWFIVDIYPFD